MSNRHNTNCVISLSELIDDPIGANAKRAEAPQPPPQQVAGQWIAFEQPECVPDGVDERPIELE